MKKACIVTICGGSNYGNRLQNLALQTVLEELNVKTDTLRNLAGEMGGALYKHSVFRGIFRSKFTELIVRRVIKNGRILKKIRFAQFNHKNIKWSKFCAHRNCVSKKLGDSYDYFVAGSDQIWNPEIPFNSDVEYLSFASDCKKIAYAASFGVSELSAEKTRSTSDRLKGFSHISVRESAGLSILEKCGISHGEVVLDPTMLIKAEQWKKFEQKPKFKVDEERYILCYFIWGKQLEEQNYINEIAKKYDCNIIDIYDPSNIDYYSVNPLEFLYLINHARFVFTDSFHASVFSILFHKQFIVKNRKGMNSRISTLTNLVGVERALQWKEENFEIKYDWGHVEELMETEREASMKFLKDALGIK